MPCDSITTQSINLANATPSILVAALEAEGWTVVKKTADNGIFARKGYSETVTWTAGKGLSVTGNQNEKTIQGITQAYSRQAVTWAAQLAGWTVKQTGQNTLSVTRR